MDHYMVSKTTGQPDWANIPALAIAQPYLQTPAGIDAFAQICYEEDGLLLHLWTHVPQIRSVETGPLGMPCEDSCLEFFFQPVPGDSRYLNLEFNSNGCMYLGIGTGIADLVRLVPDDGQSIFCPHIQMIDGGWEIFYRIPYSFVRRLFPGAAIVPGQTIRANCFACSDLTVPHYYLSWSLIEGQPFTYHRSECFGEMTFEK